jgi:hypothetical protein
MLKSAGAVSWTSEYLFYQYQRFGTQKSIFQSSKMLGKGIPRCNHPLLGNNFKECHKIH